MTYAQLKREIVNQLKAAGCADAAFDARCLLEDLGGYCDGREELPVPPDAKQAVRLAAEKRALGVPLQYLLGQWDFLDLRLKVGPGVLIPRPDTELLCETAADWLKASGKAAPRVLDLCAGTGCVGLGIASLVPGTQAELVELSDAALGYLSENLCRYPALAAVATRADVLHDAAKFEAGAYDVLVSNPPYIPTEQLPGLMREVQWEPRLALDGGDGYLFYRVIARDWQEVIRSGGLCAVEIGFDEAEGVQHLFCENGWKNVHVLKDYGGNDRVVTAEKA